MPAYVSSQNQIINQINDPSHRRIGASLIIVRLSKVNRLAALQQTSGQKDIIDIIRGRFQVLRLHGLPASFLFLLPPFCAGLIRSRSWVVVFYEMMYFRIPKREDGKHRWLSGCRQPPTAQWPAVRAAPQSGKTVAG